MLETLPSCAIATPDVPGSVDVAIGVASCQHSSVERPFRAEIAVRLKYCGGVAEIVVAVPAKPAAMMRTDESMVSTFKIRETRWLKEDGRNMFHNRQPRGPQIEF